eukprot:scaffold1770_cov375-Prasinococcus_capsulatus_cf.AAC.6
MQSMLERSPVTLTTPLLSRYHSRQGSDGVNTRKLLVDPRGDMKIQRLNLPRRAIYWDDLFHTLLNFPRVRFLILLVFIYSCQYVCFGLAYYFINQTTTVPGSHDEAAYWSADLDHTRCIPGVTNVFKAVWFSVQTSATIGYGSSGMAPNPGTRAFAEASFTLAAFDGVGCRLLVQTV